MSFLGGGTWAARARGRRALDVAQMYGTAGAESPRIVYPHTAFEELDSISSRLSLAPATG